jgi:hypothetical protein
MMHDGTLAKPWRSFNSRERKNIMADLDYLPATANNKYITQAEYDWLLWFFQNADFGPADGDVRQLLEDAYEKETGNTIPKNYRSE